MPPKNDEQAVAASLALTEAVANLNKALAQGNPAYGRQAKALSANSKALQGRSASEKTLGGVMGDMHNAIGSLGGKFSNDIKNFASPMNLLSTALREGFQTAMETQNSALQLGMQVDDVIGKFPGDMSTAMGGFTANLKTTMQQTDLGMKKLGQNTTMAAARTEALGGNTAGLIRAQRRMETHLGMDAKAVDNSSKNMVLLSQQYGISTDRMVAGLDALASNFGTFAALGIGEDMTNAVTEFTAKMGAGNEKLVSEFTKSLTAVGGASVSQAVLGGVQDIQHEVMTGNVNANMLREAAMKQGSRLQGIVSEMQSNGVNMTVAMDQLGRLYGQGAVAALQLFKKQEAMTDEQKKQVAVSEDWNNTLTILKDEIMTPIKVSLSKHIPDLIEKIKPLVPILQGILKGVMISAAAVAMKRGLGGMLAGATSKGGPDIARMLGGLGMAGVGLGGASIGAGADIGGAGAMGAAGLAAGLLPVLTTLFSKDKGIFGALKHGFGKDKGGGGGILGMGGGKLGTRGNPMYVIQTEDMLGGLSNMVPDGGMGKMFKKIPGAGKIGKLLGKGSGLDRALSKGASGLLKGTSKGIGSGVKRMFGKGAAKTFGSFMGKRLAGVAAANMVPVAGQLLTVGVLAWEGLQYWKKRKEQQAYQRDEAIRDDLHKRQEERIQAEIGAFNEGMNKSTSYLRITNQELRSAMKDQLYGGSMKASIDKLAGAIEAGNKTSEDIAVNTGDMAAKQTLDTAGE